MEIYNSPNNEELIKSLQGDIRSLWTLFSTLEGDDEFTEMKNEVQFGIKFEFNIEKVVRGYVDEYPDSNNVKIKGYRKMNLDEYWIELRARETIMRNVLRDQIKDVLPEYEEWSDAKS